MTFLSGELLAFLGALGLPILVHLLNLRRRRTRDIPTLRFLLEIESTRLRRVRLTRWLLLLLRMLLLAALVLAFARPMIRGLGAVLPSTESSRSVVVMLDESASAQLPSEGAATVWERVREAGAARLEQLDPRDQVWLLPLSRPEDLVGPLSPDAARSRLAQWKVGWGRARLSESVRKAVQVLEETTPVGRQLVLLSDLREERPTDWKGLIPDAVERVLVQVPSERQQAAPTALKAKGSLLRQGRPLEVVATVEGDGVLEALNISLELESETRARHLLATGEEGHWLREQELELAMPERGWLKGWLSLSGDAVEVDNRLPFVLHVPERRRVALIGAPSGMGTVLRAALLPDQAYGQGLEVREMDLAQASRLSTGDLDQAVLVLGDPASRAPSGVLRTLAAASLPMIVMPHPQADGAVLDAQLQALDLPGLKGVRDVQGRLEQVDFQHPLPASIFEQGGPRQLEVLPVRRLIELKTSPDDATPLRALAYAGERPLILADGSRGPHRLILATCPDPAWSGLAASGLIAPLLQQGLRWLDGDRRLPAALLCGESGELELPRSESGRDWSLQRDGASWRCVADARRLLLECPPLPEPGHYQLMVDGRSAGWVAVQVHAGESTRPVGRLEAWQAEESGGWTVRRLKDGREREAADLGPWLLGLALALLAVEGWLAAGRRKG